MPWRCASSTTSLTLRYLVVLSPRTLICGCGVFCASTDRRLSSSCTVTGSSFQYTLQVWVIARGIGGTYGAFSYSRPRPPSGKQPPILCAINGYSIPNSELQEH